MAAVTPTNQRCATCPGRAQALRLHRAQQTCGENDMLSIRRSVMSLLLIGVVVTAMSAVAQTALRFTPVTPCRVVDTRNPNGQFGGPAIQGGTSRSFAITQGACNIPPNAWGYSLNVTVVPSAHLGYLTVWPTERKVQPTVSNLNSVDGRVKAGMPPLCWGRPKGSGQRLCQRYDARDPGHQWLLHAGERHEPGVFPRSRRAGQRTRAVLMARWEARS